MVLQIRKQQKRAKKMDTSKAIQAIAEQYCLDRGITCSLDELELSDYPLFQLREIEAILLLFYMYNK